MDHGLSPSGRWRGRRWGGGEGRGRDGGGLEEGVHRKAIGVSLENTLTTQNVWKMSYFIKPQNCRTIATSDRRQVGLPRAFGTLI